MSKLTALILASLLLSITSFAQLSRISGKVADTAEKKELLRSSVLLLRKSDSILVKFNRTDKGGNFRLNGVPPGQYLLLITYPLYADYVDQLEVKDTSAITLPTIGMVLKSKLLETVVVKGTHGSIRIKGDTTEFNADSFRTQPGASVEELLRKLPGIQIDKDGKITAQGQAVQKVLVDGEEFFGDDPTLVTKNLRADMVDKVQVFDKKSDQATFTGIDDGQKQKTINLKLKDSKKNGYFGRVTAGGGTDGYYNGELMANYFRKKEKIAAYGIISNTGKTGLNWQERDNYGQSIAGAADVDETTGNVSISLPGDDLDNWSGQYGGQGFPTVKTGGLHYNNKWQDDRIALNGNYKFMQLGVNSINTTNTQTILPDTFYFNNQTQKSRNQITRHSANGSYEVKFDSTSSIKIMADGGTDHKTTNQLTSSEYLAADSALVNKNDRTTTTTGDNRVVNSNILWRKKLGRPGRTFSFNVRENYTNNTSSGFLNSNTEFYTGGLPTRDSLIDQFKNYHTENILLDSKMTYTEPITKTSFLSANYGVSINNTHSDRSSFNKDPAGKYVTLDSIYSNDYQYNVFAQRGGLTYSYIKKKIRINAGNDIGFSRFNQQDLHADTSIKRNFINWYPRASLTYSLAAQTNLNFNYFGNTTQPTLQQLQPILTNEDPLNITIGNPGLKPQFSNRFSLSYNSYKILTERGIWAYISYNNTLNAIGNRSDVDSTGKRTTQYVNVNGNYSFFGNLNYGFKWKKPDMQVSFNTAVNQSKNTSIVNGVSNSTVSGSYTLGFGLYKSKEKKYTIYMDPSATYTTSKSSINNSITTHYWTYHINPSLEVYLPFRFLIHGETDINLRQKTSAFDNNNNVVLLNAWISRKFLKNDALEIRAAGNDLLNQNVGFNRTVNSNFITQSTYNTIQRYFMFSVIWNFTKAGGLAPAHN